MKKLLVFLLCLALLGGSALAAPLSYPIQTTNCQALVDGEIVTEAREGDVVTLRFLNEPALSEHRYFSGGFTVTGGNGAPVPVRDAVFTMPDSPVRAEACTEEKGVYTVMLNRKSQPVAEIPQKLYDAVTSGRSPIFRELVEGGYARMNSQGKPDLVVRLENGVPVMERMPDSQIYVWINLSLDPDDPLCPWWALQVQCYTPFSALDGVHLELPEDLETLGEDAFRGDAAQSVYIPDGVTSIGSHAFADCLNLWLVRFPATLTEAIPEDVFEGSLPYAERYSTFVIYGTTNSPAETLAKAMREAGTETYFMAED